MKINTKDVDDLFKELTTFNPKEALKIGQKLLLKEIKKRAPVKTGNYKASWKAKKVTTERATIETDQGFLHLLLEYQGAIPHVIVPRKAPVLHWEKPPGTHHYSMRVQHPGFAPIPHVRPAIKKILPIWQDKIIELIEGE